MCVCVWRSPGGSARAEPLRPRDGRGESKLVELASGPVDRTRVLGDEEFSGCPPVVWFSTGKGRDERGTCRAGAGLPGSYIEGRDGRGPSSVELHPWMLSSIVSLAVGLSNSSRGELIGSGYDAHPREST